MTGRLVGKVEELKTVVVPTVISSPAVAVVVLPLFSSVVVVMPAIVVGVSVAKFVPFSVKIFGGCACPVSVRIPVEPYSPCSVAAKFESCDLLNEFEILSTK